MAKASLNLPYIVLTGAIVIALIVGFLLLQPQLQTIRDLRTQQKDVASQIEERRQFLQEVDLKISALRSSDAAEKELAVALPDDQSFQDIVRILERGANEVGVVVGKLSNQSQQTARQFRSQQARNNNEESSPDYIPLSADISFTGQYQQIRRYLEYIEKSPRVMGIRTLRITSGASEGNILGVDVSLGFYSYAD